MPRNTPSEPGLAPLLSRIDRLEAALERLSSLQRPPVAPVVSGAAKTTVSDADFDVAPIDGAVVIVVNTTDGTRRLAIRESSAWVVSSALS